MSFSSDSSSSSPAAAMDWKFSQVFGDKLPGEDVRDIDVISAIEFDKSGDHLAVGDRGGRVVIFQDNGGNDALVLSTPRNELERLDRVISKHPKFQYKTEFQSHEPEFDYLRSVEIEEKINKVRWCAASTGSLHILSSNDKTIKLWKVKDRQVKRVKEVDTSQPISSENSLLAEKSFINEQKSSFGNGHSLEWKENMGNGVFTYNGTHDKIACLEDASVSRSRRVYAHAHDFSINSISVNSDWETFLSGDDLRINLWNLEISNQCFNIIDMKPVNMEDLIEVITAVEFHPSHCNLLAYSSSRGFIRLVDMRKSALCDHSASILKDEEYHGQKSFFTEIIASITDMKFANDGRHILSRDFMNLKLWDMHMDSGPVATIKIHENLRPKLADLYNNDAIFDKFECCVAKDRLNFATGSYSNILRVFSNGGGAEGVTIEAYRNPTRKPQSQTTSRPRRSSLSNIARGFYRQGDSRSAESNEFSYDFNSKLLHMAWHPTTNLIACAAGSSLLMYHA
ncbi:serine/threonine protein phosphatase 2A 55 kDa regulatory subunit B beta isoform-like isoform X1 [Salvia miltiorrhiza]|uniref:serine/threonine protein phosphatase 2A 55 kDa regulatory subunit B beta isoform-like isoform X1 n=1 Tax=Salvia miltiorrhiza TaxID=226208 RepID=UPI0025AB5DD1|nr:serine/threonine protein phosphatase 2A 55 kDa regulatory subunit B beta isoform-like isoform X1 [Salvia miltiorrhiza]